MHRGVREHREAQGKHTPFMTARKFEVVKVTSVFKTIKWNHFGLVRQC